MRLEEFDFTLPPQQIAQFPTAERDGSRLLVLNRTTGAIQHCDFRSILEFLEPEDCLVVNETRVLRARLVGRKRATGGQVEILLLRQEAEKDSWLAMASSFRSLRAGSALELCGGELSAEIVEKVAPGRVRVRIWRRQSGLDTPLSGAAGMQLLEEFGEIPLPPYIRRQAEASDESRYQTVYGGKPGAIAAPTAGLHFTVDLLAEIRALGIEVCPLILHIGPGTFEPVRTSDPRQHQLEAEYYELDESAAHLLNERRQAGGRIVAVGTTVVRVLETVTSSSGIIEAGTGWTDRFIYPPFHFNAVDALVTNFHLPRSSLLLLVAAFAGQRQLKQTYDIAIAEGYRFYSYGDAMFIH